MTNICGKRLLKTQYINHLRKFCQINLLMIQFCEKITYKAFFAKRNHKLNFSCKRKYKPIPIFRCVFSQFRCWPFYLSLTSLIFSLTAAPPLCILKAIPGNGNRFRLARKNKFVIIFAKNALKGICSQNWTFKRLF